MLCIKGCLQPDGVAMSPKPWGMPPSPQELPKGPWALVRSRNWCAPYPCPCAGGAGGERVGGGPVCQGSGVGFGAPARPGAHKPGPAASAALPPAPLLPACLSLPAPQLRGQCHPQPALSAQGCCLPRLARGLLGLPSSRCQSPLRSRLLSTLLAPTLASLAPTRLLHRFPRTGHRAPMRPLPPATDPTAPRPVASSPA